MARREAAAKNHDHPGDPHLRNFNSAMQVQRERAPSKTITSGGEAPQMSMPLLPGGRVQDAGDAYARMLSAKLPEEAPPARPGARLASFFCCGGGIDLGFRSAGFELAFANDISARAVETFGANLGHAPLHRDIREVGPADYPKAPVDVVTGGFPCFPAGTLITTRRGLVGIEEVVLGDQVLTHKGRWRKVITTMQKPAAPLLDILFMGGSPLRATAEHPFYARKRTIKNGHPPTREFSEPEWVDAADLTRDHFVAQPIDPCGEHDATLSPADCYLIGRWLGDGWVVDYKRTSKVPQGQRGSRVNSRCKKVIICCSKEEAPNLAAKIEAAGHHATLAAERTVAKFHISSAALVDSLRGFGKYAHGKKLPEWVHALPLAHKRALWDGWHDADGHDSSQGLIATTVSEKLVHGMARVARSLFGVAVSIMKVDMPLVGLIEGRVVNQRPQYRLSVPRQNKEAFVQDGIAWVPVRSVEHSPALADVYNLEVEGDNSYVAGSVAVHNCTTFSMAGKRMGVTDDLNGKLYLALCRVIEELSPRYFVAENVEGILSANGGAAVKYVVAAFLRLGYRTDYQLVNMAEHGVPQTRKRVIFVGVRLDQWRGSFRFPPKTHRLHDDKLAPRWLPPARTLREAIGDLPPPNEKLLGMMHGDAAEKLARGPGVSSYQSSKPRRADRPSHSQTTQGGVLHEQDTVPNHGRKLRPLCEKYNSDRTKIGRAAKPSPTIISESISPWVPDHDENTSPVSPTHAMSKRVARGGRRAPTVVSEASNVQPWLNQHEVNDTPAYPSFAQASNAAPGGRPAPTVSTPKQNAPFVASGALNAFDKSAVAGRRPPTGKNDPSPTILSTMPPMLTGRDDVSARNPDFFNPMRTSASPSPTMTAGGQTEVAERGGAMRRMTVRECARVQSFPDWYEFKGSQADGYTLVGNAVPPLYARRLAEAILEYDARELAT